MPRLTAIIFAIAATAAINAQETQLYDTHVLPESLMIEPLGEMAMVTRVDLILRGPGQFYQRKSFDAGELIEFDPASVPDGAMPDGTYHYEVRIMDIQGMDSNRVTGEIYSVDPGPWDISGAFSINNGQIVPPNQDEDTSGKSPQGITATGSSTNAQPELGTQQLIAENLYVDGKACIGTNCVNGENLGSDTLRLQEDNTRLRFHDTSDPAGPFPTNDWELTANDSTSGGASHFSILDVDAGRQIFTVEAAAPSNSLYVDNSGRVGFGTSNPAVEGHYVDGDTPTTRLEQDGSSFRAQTWDIAGNEAHFFIRDVTGGSTLPFRIRPGAPTSSIDIANGGNVGFGTTSPETPIHVDEAAGGDTNMLMLSNNGGSRIYFRNRTAPESGNDSRSWVFATTEPGFRVSRTFSGQTELELDNSGNLSIAGTLSQGSSRAIKSNLVSLSGKYVLAKLAQLNFLEWEYISKPDQRHAGPMAEDFHAAFGLGPDDKHIAPGDMAGLSLAAVKELHAENEELKERVARLERALKEIGRR